MILKVVPNCNRNIKNGIEDFAVSPVRKNSYKQVLYIIKLETVNN
jgi:hypothetical protein